MTQDCIGVPGTIDVPMGVSMCPRDRIDVSQGPIDVSHGQLMSNTIDVAQGLSMCPRDY
jgi:hypothetical protein